MKYNITPANKEHFHYAEPICKMMAESAKIRGTGIAQRQPEYICKKMEAGHAIIALHKDKVIGFCYIESWENQKYVANSGLIIHPDYRKKGLAKKIKKATFDLSKKNFPNAKLFGITTSMAVMKINSNLGYHPVTFSELTQDEKFWQGCSTCVNYDILQRTNKTMCLCTGMVCDLSKVGQNKNPSTWKEFKDFFNQRKKRLQKAEKQFPLLNKFIQHPKEKVVLAFSGGLDTSYCVKYLKHEKQMDVYSAIVNTGGFSTDELAEIEKKAYDLGVTRHIALEETVHYYDSIIKYLIFGNVLKNNTYPLSVSAERIHQAIALANYAKSIGASAIAHGSTGAGNDQIRFDLAFQLIAPDIKIITPIRDQQLSRQAEIEYLKKHGVEVDWKKARYSINKGLWGTSVGGAETLTSHQALPESAFPSQLTETEPKTLAITFKRGELCRVNGRELTPVEAIQTIEETARQYAIGRDIHVGDTIIGIKGRVGFEAAAASIIIKAHHTLEKHTLSKWQLHWKEQLSNWYGMFIHEAMYFEPVMRNIETFLETTQAHVSGTVTIQLFPYRFTIVGIESEHDLMTPDFGAYGEMNKNWSGDDVKGFTKILANSIQIFNHVNSEEK